MVPHSGFTLETGLIIKFCPEVRSHISAAAYPEADEQVFGSPTNQDYIDWLAAGFGRGKKVHQKSYRKFGPPRNTRITRNRHLDPGYFWVTGVLRGVTGCYGPHANQPS